MSEDFSAYSSTTNMLADPLGLYSVAEDNTTSQMALDRSTGANIDGLNLAQSMRYDYNAPGCSTQSVGRNLTLPSATSEVWVEVYMKFSSNFTTRNVNGCSTPPDFKALFGRLTGLNCRVELHVGGASGGTAFAVGGPGRAAFARRPTRRRRRQGLPRTRDTQDERRRQSGRVCARAL